MGGSVVGADSRGALLLGPAHGTLLGGVVLDVLERAKDGPQLADEVALVVVVEVSEEGLDGLGSLVGLVEGDAAETWSGWARTK